MSGAQTRWYAVHTRARCETKAEHHLMFQGFRVFAPVIVKTARHARKVSRVRVPMFPRYIFVALDVDRDRWRCINGTIGVVSLLTADNRPLPLPPGFVEALIETEAEHLHMDEDSPFKLDTSVHLRDGPFSDLVGRIREIDDKGRVQILLDVMGRMVPLRTTIGMLVAITA